MYDVKNQAGKLVCRVNTQTMAIEIIRRGHKTVVAFNHDKSLSVTNSLVKTKTNK